MVKFRCAGINTGMINGIGISLEVFFQGCRADCYMCQNPDLQNMVGGTIYDTDMILQQLEDYKGLYTSLVFLGGEPCLQEEAVCHLASGTNLPTVLYTGMYLKDVPNSILGIIDYVVDGPYVHSLKTGGFPVSSNQTAYKRDGTTFKPIKTLTEK